MNTVEIVFLILGVLGILFTIIFFCLSRRSAKKDSENINQHTNNAIEPILTALKIGTNEKQKESFFIEKEDKIDEKENSKDLKNIITSYGRLSYEAYLNIQRSKALKAILNFEELTNEMIASALPYFFEDIVNSYYVYQDAKNALLKIKEDIEQDVTKKALRNKIEGSLRSINVYDPLVISLWQNIIKEGIPEIQKQIMNWEGKKFKEKLQSLDLTQK